MKKLKTYTDIQNLKREKKGKSLPSLKHRLSYHEEEEMEVASSGQAWKDFGQKLALVKKDEEDNEEDDGEAAPFIKAL